MILIFGSINLDLLVPVPYLPQPGETVLGGDYALLPGGKGANQGLAARRAGSEVMLAGAVGEDRFGGIAVDMLLREGVDTHLVRRVGHPTGCAAIMVSAAGENAIAVSPVPTRPSGLIGSRTSCSTRKRPSSLRWKSRSSRQ
jgi:ribokinase